MSAITIIDLSTPNDGAGDPLRTGGTYINTNFANLNTDKLEKGGYLGTAQDLEDAINNISVAGFVDTTTNQNIDGQKNFLDKTDFTIVEITTSLNLTGTQILLGGTAVGITTDVETVNELGQVVTMQFISGILYNTIIT